MANIIIPLLNKTKIQAAQSLDFDNTISDGLAILCYLLLLRAQISMTLRAIKINHEKIPQLDSSKWSAGAIARTSEIRKLTTLLAVTDTLPYIFNLSGETLTTAANLKKTALDELNSIRVDKPAPGCRVLPSNILNKDNIRFHQFGLISQYIGKWQSMALHEPTLVVKDCSITTLDFGTYALIYLGLMENLELRINNCISTMQQLETFIAEKLYSEPISFYDGVDLGTEDNKLPLERQFKVDRIGSQEKPKIKISESDIDDPLIKLISANLNIQKQLVGREKLNKGTRSNRSLKSKKRKFN